MKGSTLFIATNKIEAIEIESSYPGEPIYDPETNTATKKEKFSIIIHTLHTSTRLTICDTYDEAFRMVKDINNKIKEKKYEMLSVQKKY